MHAPHALQVRPRSLAAAAVLLLAFAASSAAAATLDVTAAQRTVLTEVPAAADRAELTQLLSDGGERDPAVNHTLLSISYTK